MFKIFITLCLLSITFVNVFAGDPIPTTSPSTGPSNAKSYILKPGTYQGIVKNDGKDSPVTTIITQDLDGNMVGTYTIIEANTQYEGKLINFHIDDTDLRACRFDWTDKYGHGVLVVLVSPESKQFVGRWGDGDSFATELWTGSLQAAKASTTSTSTKPTVLP